MSHYRFVQTAFGSGQIKRELSISSPEELTLVGYKNQIQLDRVAAPLTEAEEIKNEIKALEITSVTTRTETVPGLKYDNFYRKSSLIYFCLSFPVEQAACDAIRDFAVGKVDYVRFAIDTDNEFISCCATESLKGSADQLQTQISTTKPNYHLFKFKYNHNSKSLSKPVFIYSIPSEGVPTIKVRINVNSLARAGQRPYKKAAPWPYGYYSSKGPF